LKKIFYSPGEPSGIGVDLIIQLCLSNYWSDFKAPIICLGDKRLFEHRAKTLKKKIAIVALSDSQEVIKNKKGLLQIIEIAKCKSVIPGKLNPSNANYILDHLNFGIAQAKADKKNALVTGPISKQNIIDSGIKFSGHTEWIQKMTKSDDVLMLLAAKQLRVALTTTHIPLYKVAKSITKERVINKAIILNEDLKLKLKIKKPRLMMLGLNPHAGEGGTIGSEETLILQPAAKYLRKIGVDISDPISADTAFTPNMLKKTDAYLAMYHDQALPVLKALSFGEGINITLGVPIVRTSVDHGVALDIAGTGKASYSSLQNALNAASSMI
tara:strand:+ start:8920 stop:9900 length:981 start_codon:yes stop_codon:yes gene_type:complete